MKDIHTKIHNSQTEETKKRIISIESTIPQAGFKEGILSPDWEKISDLQSLMTAYNVPGLSIALINIQLLFSIAREYQWLI
jgi:hypothetical protein